MSSWSDILNDVHIAGAESPVDRKRKEAITKLSEIRNRNVICYYSGWLQKSDSVSEMAITDNDMNGLMNAVYSLDRSKGLDLVLHTPGGDLAATEAIVKYLRDCFNNDICAIVPQMAMSAGTMIACSCKEIIMGKQSSLGPTDPQFRGVAAGDVIEEFQRAVDQVTSNPSSAVLWGQIIGKYGPTFLGDCEKAVEMSKDIVETWLRTNMFSNDGCCDETITRILDKLCEHSESAMHNRHFSYKDLKELGLKIAEMENDDKLQDAILTLHHLYMITFQQTIALKIIESSNGKGWIVATNPAKQN